MIRRVVIVFAIAIPALLVANVYQAYRYNKLEQEIARLQVRQQELIEQNKRDILARSILSSPQRIGPMADRQLGLRRIEEANIIRMDSDGVAR